MPAAVPKVAGILETALYVDDLERATSFYRRLFDFELHAQDHRISIFLVPRQGVLLLLKRGASSQPHASSGGMIPGSDASGPQHVCFAIPSAEFDVWERRLMDQAIEIESAVKWEAGGRSLYFRDPDNHCIELATPGTWPHY